MGNLVGLLISSRHQRSIRAALFVLVLGASLAIGLATALTQVHEGMKAQVGLSLAPYARLRDNVDAAFEAMQREVTATPCGELFNQQLRRVAYLPDGLNEFLYAPGGVVQCTANLGRLAVPHALGPPDHSPLAEAAPSGIRFWIDRDLGFLALAGLTGSLVQVGDFAVVVPPQPLLATAPPWMSTEVVLVGAQGRWWHRGGATGIYAGHIADGQGEGLVPLHGAALHHVGCDVVGLYCVIAEVTLAGLLAHGALVILGMLLASAILAAWLSRQLHRLLRRFWAFEARFLRHFDAASVVCHYQPILDLRTDRVTACEVLVRWRDVDDRIVMPDQFLPVVEARGLTMDLTRYLVARARADLDRLPPGIALQVNFNVFPRDLDADRLIPLFAPLLGDRFRVVIEIVETDTLDIAAAGRHIERLRAAGIGTYLDDFGSGFSNINHLGALPLDGVKLDRQFAMASDASLTGQLLVNALAMIHDSGRVTVVEGVETAGRLAMLRATGMVDFIQGYLVSRPLDIERFAGFLAETDLAGGNRRLAA